MIVIFAMSFISIGFSYYFNQKNKIREEQRRQRMLDKQDELLDRLKNRQL